MQASLFNNYAMMIIVIQSLVPTWLQTVLLLYLVGAGLDY